MLFRSVHFPKARNSAELARDHVLIEAPSGLITITGGKWTTYRLMAEQTVDLAVKLAGLAPVAPCRTAKLKLFDPADEVAALKAQGWDRRLHPDHPYDEADVFHAVRQEDAIHAIDVLARRLTLALVDRAAARQAAPKVIELMAGELGWDEASKQSEMALVEKRLTEAL